MSGARIRIHDDGYGRLHLRWWADDTMLWRQILDSFRVMLESVGSDLTHIVHVNVFLSQMSVFEAMNAAYIEKLGGHRPARTVIGVRAHAAVVSASAISARARRSGGMTGS